jgi:sugar phosphate isomerase/epimerase
VDISKSNHLHVKELLSSNRKLANLSSLLQQYNMAITGMGSQGNPIHPNRVLAKQYQKDFINTTLLAEKLHVDTILLLSGCPGGSSSDKTPNWITCPWPNDYAKSLEYQWNEVLIPYWTNASKFASEHGIKKLAIEPHPGFCVYNTETLLKLRLNTSPIIGANFDPSHFFWQGIDPCVAIHALGDCIFHVHAKDCFVNPEIVKLNGILDPKPYSDFVNRSWNFRTVGYGHSDTIWKNIISALAQENYTGTISIEHEDPLMTREEGLDKAIILLKNAIINNSPTTKWWELRPEG